MTCVCSVLEAVQGSLLELGQVSKAACDLLECRIGRLLRHMSDCTLLNLPEDSPVSPEELLQRTEATVKDAAAALGW